MTVIITEKTIRMIAPGADDSILRGIVDHQSLLKNAGINTPLRVAHFLGQCAHETRGFTRLEESLYYTTASRLMAVWPTRFPTRASATPFLRNPQKLANKVYANRLGNTGPNDGWRYRGSGMTHTTGKYNFSVVQKQTHLPVVDQPELLRKMPHALLAAAVFWEQNNLVRFADADDISGLTRAIQGAQYGLSERRVYTERARKALATHDGPSSAALPYPSQPAKKPILRNGSYGKSVKKLQRRLKAHGIDLNDDGIFGDDTFEAVERFQAEHGLMVDGVVGPSTWAALLERPRRPAKSSDQAPNGKQKPQSGIDMIITMVIIVVGAIAAWLKG